MQPSSSSDLHFDTLALRSHPVKQPALPVATPIYTSVTYDLQTTQHGADLCSYDTYPPAKGAEQGQYLYSRWGSPTNDAVAALIASLESGYQTHLFSSGMAAISTVLFALLRSGDHVVACHSIYGGAHDVLLRILPTYGVQVSWIDVPDIENYRKAIQPNTKVLYGETSSNPLLTILDLEAFGQLGRESKILTVVDNTFCSPYLVKPLKLNIDVVIHSATKYLGGHSDVLAGCATYASKEVCDKVYYHMRLFGGVLSPFDAFLLERGVKTLPLRMEAHCKNALKLAQYLEAHPKIERVLYPGLASHPHHALAKRLYEHGGFGGMMAFDVKGGVEAGARFVESLKVIHLAVSLGGVESLISHPATMTHRHVPTEDRRRSGISDGMMRFSVGVENVDDLIADLSQALEKL